MDKYKTTFETWNKLASLYQEKFMDLSLYNETYDLFCRLVTEANPAILEIGCGPGNITRYMLEARPDFRFLATDVAPEMIRLAGINNPGIEVAVMDCRDILSVNKKFDGIVCGFCIPYLSAEDCHQLIENCSRLLESRGWFYFSTIKGDYNLSGFEKSNTGDSAYVYYYMETFFEKALQEQGFTLAHLIEIDFPKADGTLMVNQVFIAQKI